LLLPNMNAWADLALELGQRLALETREIPDITKTDGELVRESFREPTLDGANGVRGYAKRFVLPFVQHLGVVTYGLVAPRRDAFKRLAYSHRRCALDVSDARRAASRAS